MKNWNQLNQEVFEIISGKDIMVMIKVLDKNFPKARGILSRLKIDELERLIPLLKEAYGEV